MRHPLLQRLTTQLLGIIAGPRQGAVQNASTPSSSSALPPSAPVTAPARPSASFDASSRMWLSTVEARWQPHLGTWPVRAADARWTTRLAGLPTHLSSKLPCDLVGSISMAADTLANAPAGRRTLLVVAAVAPHENDREALAELGQRLGQNGVEVNVILLAHEGESLAHLADLDSTSTGSLTIAATRPELFAALRSVLTAAVPAPGRCLRSSLCLVVDASARMAHPFGHVSRAEAVTTDLLNLMQSELAQTSEENAFAA